MKLQDLFEEQNLIGKTVDGKTEFSGKPWDGSFDCSDYVIKLTSLKGSPSEVTGYFYCMKQPITSLEGAPKRVDNDANFYKNDNLTSLKGTLKYVGADLVVTKCSLETLEGMPEVGQSIYIFENNLTSLKGIQPIIHGRINASSNKLNTFEHFPSIINIDVLVRDNNFTSLKNIHKTIKEIGGIFELTGNPIKSHILGLLKIKRLRYVELDNKEVEKIVNKYLPEGDILACQQELIDAGYEEFAQL